jgi:hypothetical protein
MFGIETISRVFVLAIAAGVSLPGYAVGGFPQAEFRRSYALNPNGRVMVQNLYGDVRITAWDRDEVLVEAATKSRDPKHLDARIVVDSTEDAVSIFTQYAGADAEHPASVDYHIWVPRMAALDGVKLINGMLSISGVGGPVRASSVNGGIHAERLAGEADLSTVNGLLEADFYQISPEKPILLRSVNGPIRLQIPSGAPANLDARSHSGGIDSDFGRPVRVSGGNLLRTLVKRGGTRIALHNVNGGISIRAGINKGERPWS